MDKLNQIKEILKDIKEIELSEKEKEILDYFKRITIEYKNRDKWMKEGRCYKCGGEVYLKEKKLLSDFKCSNCNQELYTDALEYYYFKPVFEMLDMVLEDYKEWIDNG